MLDLRDDYYATGGDSAGAADVGGSQATGSAGEPNGSGGTSGAGTTIGGAPTADAGADFGGAADAPRCAEHPLTAVSSWVPSASSEHTMEPPAGLTDKSPKRWSSGKPQSGDEWVQIDFGAQVSIRNVNLQQGTVNSNDYPRQYSVRVSDKSEDLSGPACVTGVGKSGVSTSIDLPSVFTGRYLLIRQLGASLSWWSAEEVEVSCFDD